MRIYLTQHGVALPNDVDANRPLSEQGRRDVRHLTDFLEHAGVHVERVLHSGKTRAEQTAGILAKPLLTAGQAREHAGIGPKDPVEGLASEIASWSADTLIVGHLPFLCRLVSYLLVADPDRPLLAFQPGSMACLERDADGRWVLVCLIRPELISSEQE